MALSALLAAMGAFQASRVASGNVRTHLPRISTASLAVL